VFKDHRLCVSLNSRLESNKEEEDLGCGVQPTPTHRTIPAGNNRCLANWATVVCQKEELSTHWISLYLSYSHPQV